MRKWIILLDYASSPSLVLCPECAQKVHNAYMRTASAHDVDEFYPDDHHAEGVEEEN